MTVKLGTIEASLASLDKVLATCLRYEKKFLVVDIHKAATVFSPFCARCENATTRNALSFKIVSSFSDKAYF